MRLKSMKDQFAIAALLSLAVALPGQAEVRRTVATMGTWLELEVSAKDRNGALAASEAAVRAVAAVEARLSTWRPDSEISRAHATLPGQWVALGAATAADLQFAFDFACESGGTFQPTIGALLDAHGLRGERRWPTAAALATALAASAGNMVELRADAMRRQDAAAWVATDGFAKGIALRAAAAAVRAAGAAATFDFGGQWFVEGGRPARLQLAHPDQRDRAVATFLLQPGFSASTTGNGERRELVDGRPFGHLFDPRTGGFAADFGSVTVVAADPARADAASTALFVAGPADGIALAERLRVEAVFVVRCADEAPRLVATPGLRRTLDLLP
jgi:thiamine biosynthesis lipoprotein